MKSEVVGFIFFGAILLFSIIAWEIYFSGKIVDLSYGEVVDIDYLSAGRGSGVMHRRAKVKLEDGGTVWVFCESCRKGQRVRLMKRKSVFGSGYVYEAEE